MVTVVRYMCFAAWGRGTCELYMSGIYEKGVSGEWQQKVVIVVACFKSGKAP